MVKETCQNYAVRSATVDATASCCHCCHAFSHRNPAVLQYKLIVAVLLLGRYGTFAMYFQ